MANRGQVVQIEPFRPYEERAAAELGLPDRPTLQTLDAQMQWLQGEIARLHAAIFSHIDDVARCVVSGGGGCAGQCAGVGRGVGGARMPPTRLSSWQPSAPSLDPAAFLTALTDLTPAGRRRSGSCRARGA